MSERVTAVIDRLSKKKVRRVVTGYLRTGKRTDVLTVGPQGRYIRSRPPKGETVSDIAILPTIKAAILHAKDGKIEIKKGDYREKVKRRKISSLICIVLDTSSSMISHVKMEAIKEVMDELLLDAYQKRDRISLITCHGTGAEVLLPFTSSVERGKYLIEKIDFGGTTPLAAGMRKGVEMLKSRMRSEAETIPILVVVTDGTANTPVSTAGDVKVEIEETCEVIKELGIRSVFLHVGAGGRDFMERMAALSGGVYYPVLGTSSGYNLDVSRVEEQDALLREIEQVLLDEDAKGLVFSGIEPDIIEEIIDFIRRSAPDIDRVSGCNFGCSPSWDDNLCFHCKLRKNYGDLPSEKAPMPILTLPEDAAVTDLLGELYVRYIPNDSIFLRANRGILHINNFAALSSPVKEALYSVISRGYSEVSNENYTLRYPCNITLVGYSPDAKDSLPPHLASYLRFVNIAESDPFDRLIKEVIYEKKYDTDPAHFLSSLEKQRAIRIQTVVKNVSSLGDVRFPEGLEHTIDVICGEEQCAKRVKRSARGNAVLDGREFVSLDDISGALVSEGLIGVVEDSISGIDDERVRAAASEILGAKIFPALVTSDDIMGVLINGFSNEAVEVAVEYISSLNIEFPVVKGCPNRCDPYDKRHLCRECNLKYGDSVIPVETTNIPVMSIDGSVTAGELIGRVYMKYSVVDSILQDINGGLLFVKDIDKLSDEAAFVLSSVLESGELLVPGQDGNIVQKGRFVLVGTVREGGTINPLLFEHISMIVDAEDRDLAAIAISAVSGISRREEDAQRLRNAREWVNGVTVGDSELDLITRVCSRIGTKGNTAEIVIESLSRSLAALAGRRRVLEDDIISAVRFGLPVIAAEANSDETVEDSGAISVTEART